MIKARIAINDRNSYHNSPANRPFVDGKFSEGPVSIRDNPLHAEEEGEITLREFSVFSVVDVSIYI